MGKSGADAAAGAGSSGVDAATAVGSSVVDAAAGDGVDVGIGVEPGQERRLVLAKKGL